MLGSGLRKEHNELNMAAASWAPTSKEISGRPVWHLTVRAYGWAMIALAVAAHISGLLPLGPASHGKLEQCSPLRV